MRAGHRLLRLNHFQVVGHTCAETIARLCKRLIGQIHGTAGDFHLVGSGDQVQQCYPNIVVNLAANIAQL